MNRLGSAVAKAPWYSGPIHVASLLVNLFLFCLFVISVPILPLVPPVAVILLARPYGMLAHLAAGAFCLWYFARLFAVVARGLSDIGNGAELDEVSRWVGTRRWTATPDASMGGWLRRERQERGVPLAAITAKTYIHEKYLRAIEDDRFDVLPGRLIRRSFLRQYAQEVGLAPGTVVALFDLYVYGVVVLNAAALVHAAASAPTNTRAGVAMRSEVVPVRTPLSHRAASTVFGIVEALLPKRLAHEELGDALEYIAANPHGWRVVLKIVSTIFWTAVNAVREWRSAFGKKAG